MLLIISVDTSISFYCIFFLKCTIYELIYLDYECVYILYIVPADDMGVVGHTQKMQTPMSFANSHKYKYIYTYIYIYVYVCVSV